MEVGAPPDLVAAKAGIKPSRGANFRCLMSGSPNTGDYIKAQRKAKRMGARLMAVVADGDRGLDEVLAEQEGDFDADSRWALDWFDQYGFGESRPCR